MTQRKPDQSYRLERCKTAAGRVFDRLIVPKAPTLASLPSRQIEEVLGYMLGELDACDDGICHEQAPVFEAVALLLDTELRLRAPRRHALVVVDPDRFRCAKRKAG